MLFSPLDAVSAVDQSIEWICPGSLLDAIVGRFQRPITSDFCNATKQLYWENCAFWLKDYILQIMLVGMAILPTFLADNSAILRPISDNTTDVISLNPAWLSIAVF